MRRFRAGLHRKRVALVRNEKDPISNQLRRARDLIQKRHYTDAFKLLDSLAAETLPTERQWQIRVLLANAQLRRRKPDAAKTLVATSDGVLESLGREWLSVATTEIRAIHTNSGIEPAQARALSVVDLASKIAQKQAISVQAPAVNQSVLIAAQPHRPSSVAVRLGTLFLEAGELNAAEILFARAEKLEATPASGLLAGRAKLHLIFQRYQEAADTAVRSIQVGQFHAKTLRAISILIAARRAMGQTGLDLNFWRGIQQAAPSVRNRFTLLAVVHLRRFADPLWHQLAEDWLTSAAASSDPIIRAELQKLLLADLRRTHADPSVKAAAAQALSACPKLAMDEMVLLAGEAIKAAATLGTTPPVGDWLARATREYAPARIALFRHSLATRLARTGQVAVARDLLTQNLVNQPGQRLTRLRSMWALAVLERSVGHVATASAFFGQIVQDIDTVSNGRAKQALYIRSLLAWTSSLGGATSRSILGTHLQKLSKLVETLGNAPALFRVARGLIGAPVVTKGVAMRAMERGHQLTKDLIRSPDSVPAKTALVLFRAGRALRDFGQHAEIAALWNELPAATQGRLWNSGPEFWSFLGDVFTALHKVHQSAQANALAAQVLTDSSVSNEGIAIFGTLQGLRLIRQGNSADAFGLFARVVAVAPQHLMASRGYYWFSLQALKQGDSNRAQQLAARIATCLPVSPTLKWQKSLALRALYVASGSNKQNLSAKITSAQLDQLPIEIERITDDIKYVR